MKFLVKLLYLFWNVIPHFGKFWYTLTMKWSRNDKHHVEIAKSYEDARSKAVPPKFYLDKEEETVMVRTEYKKLRNKALSELQKLYDKPINYNRYGWCNKLSIYFDYHHFD